MALRNGLLLLVAAALAAQCAGQITPQQNFLPTTITVSQAPYDIIATPITPNAPYSQRDYQCNISGDSRIPQDGRTFPLTVRVPNGQRVRVIFANGNLNGAAITVQGEPGVIVQQPGAVIVQQAGYASPIVQPISSPIVQQASAPPAALVVQQGPTQVVQQPQYPQAQSVPNPPPTPPVPQTPPATPAAQTTTTSSSTPAPTPRATPAPTTRPGGATPPSGAASQPPATPTLPTTTSALPPQAASTVTAAQTPAVAPGVSAGGRKLLQETVPGGPNNGQVEYVALATNNTVPGFVVPNTRFGVPYIEFTASQAAAGQTATFRGVLEVAQVIGGVPQYPFRPNPRLSPECQVNVNFVVA